MAFCNPVDRAEAMQCHVSALFLQKWNDNIDLDLELFAPNGCHM